MRMRWALHVDVTELCSVTNLFQSTVSPKAQVNHANHQPHSLSSTLSPVLSFEIMAFDMTQDIPSAQPHPQQAPISSPTRTPHGSQDLADGINAPFPVLDHETLIDPYNSNQNQQPDFERDVAEGIMRLMMNIRAWAEARPAHESAREKNHLIAEVQHIENREREQGTSVPSFWELARQRLVGFVASVKSALENLQG
ncbi:unnamed protein product [Rhizoctonia solani]|uniref:Uncharacterized protein n=1 Tax=Rhizoctonia solani TaxID=456999 RepID=A0A8H2X9D0_9AGAM|nr:unnamed protein product [Rhizoctonia solani]